MNILSASQVTCANHGYYWYLFSFHNYYWSIPTDKSFKHVHPHALTDRLIISLIPRAPDWSHLANLSQPIKADRVKASCLKFVCFRRNSLLSITGKLIWLHPGVCKLLFEQAVVRIRAKWLNQMETNGISKTIIYMGCDEIAQLDCIKQSFLTWDHVFVSFFSTSYLRL